MSHFTVAVIVNEQSIDELEAVLAPYDENLSVEPYIAETKEEIIESARSYKTKYTELKNAGEDISDFWLQYVNAETDEELYQLERYDDEEYDEAGNRLSTYNPNSKWDYYDIGGRWKNALLTSSENDDTWEHNSYAEHEQGIKINKQAPDGFKWVNGAKIKDIEFSRMNEGRAQTAKREWELFVEHQEPITERERERVKFNFYNESYFIDRYGTKENYVRINSSFQTYALVDKTGWYETGKMGYWGVTFATAESTNAFYELFQRYISDPNNREKYMVIVDCHI